MIEDHEVDALREIAIRIRSHAEQPQYGGFPGGDPRDFSPDPECCTADELERHRIACHEWEEGRGVDIGGPHIALDAHPDIEPDCIVRYADGSGHMTVNAYGLGVYTYRDDELVRLAQDLDDLVDRIRQVSP
jgi:hypothetical protein